MDARDEIRRISDIWVGCRNEHAGSGPWLYGTFTIADAMFAPVASRFHTYGIALDPQAAKYKDAVLSDPQVRKWYEDARQETEVIAIYE